MEQVTAKMQQMEEREKQLKEEINRLNELVRKLLDRRSHQPLSIMVDGGNEAQLLTTVQKQDDSTDSAFPASRIIAIAKLEDDVSQLRSTIAVLMARLQETEDNAAVANALVVRLTKAKN